MSHAVQENQRHYSERAVADAVLISDSFTTPERFAGLFDRHAPVIHRYAARRLGPDAADDLVAETFLLAFARRAGYDTRYPDARPWLFGIATNLIARAATTALTQPVAGPGQYIYTEVTGPAGVILADGRPGIEPAVVQTWQSVDGTKAGAIEGHNACGPLGYAQFGLLPGETLSPPPSGPPLKTPRFTPKPTPATCSATILPASWSPPASTYAGLKTLPASPAALLAYLNAHFQWPIATGMTVDSAAREYMAISTILENLGILPGALESAMFRALAELPGMTVVPHVTDYAGRTGTAVGWSNDGDRYELIFNPSTYQFMGQQEVAEPGNPDGTPAGQVVSGMAVLATGVTSTAPATSRNTAFYPLLWQDFAAGQPDTN